MTILSLPQCLQKWLQIRLQVKKGLKVTVSQVLHQHLEKLFITLSVIT